jgi:hypothetical protein
MACALYWRGRVGAEVGTVYRLFGRWRQKQLRRLLLLLRNADARLSHRLSYLSSRASAVWPQ